VVALLVLPAGALGAFPGANGKIAFHTTTSAPPGVQIELINPDSTGRAPLTGSPVFDLSPAWSPDGTKLVFSRFAGAPTFDREIWVINADGTGADQLTTGNDDQRPAFSGDGTRITFQRFDGGDTEIMVANADGSGVVPVTNNTEFDFNPVFSPNSSRIAFDRENAVSGNEIWVMNADGSGQTALTPTDGSWVAEEPDWSPDGTRLTFHRCDADDNECTGPDVIVTISAAAAVVPGTETIVSTPDFMVPEVDSAPVYSPDGTRIAFERFNFGNQSSNVFTAPVAGGSQPQLTSAGTDEDPDWQPIVTTKNRKKCRGVPVTITSTNRDDVILGTPGRDVVHGQRGDDVIKGFKGNDRLCGGRGVDHIHGGPGKDVIFGGNDIDFLFGDGGIDRIFGGTPNASIRFFIDHCWGGSGRDSFRNCQRRKGLEKKLGG
jgi:Tol biopolymer transport system component